MTETSVSPPSAIDDSLSPIKETNPGCLSEIKWIASAWALACFSLAFYRHAVRRPVWTAILLLFIVGLIASVLQTGSITRAFLAVGEEVRTEFESGEVSEIRITSGIVEVDGPQPLILIDKQGILAAIDTSGALDTNILRENNGKYQQGILLTETRVAILNRNGRYQEMPLSQLQQLLGDPFILY